MSEPRGGPAPEVMPWPAGPPGGAPLDQLQPDHLQPGNEAIPGNEATPGRSPGPYRPGERPPSRLPAAAAWWAVPGAAAGVVLASIGAGIGLALTGSTTSALTQFLGEVGLWAAMLATAALVSRRYGAGRLRTDFGLAIKARDLVIGLIAAAIAIGLAQAVVVAFKGTRFYGSNDQLLTQQQGHELGFVVVALIVAVGAPFFEELFFRGYLRTCLQARFGAHLAIWLQALAFAAAHLGEVKGWANVSVVTALFLVGAVLGYTAKLTGRLGAGMVAHGSFNLLAVLTVL